MTDSRSEILQLFDAYATAVLAKDVDTFVAIFAADVRVFDTWDAWSYDGIAAWRRMADAWLGSLGDDRVAVEWEDIRVSASADVAVAHAFVIYRAIDLAGNQPRAMRNRLTWGLERRDGRWVVVHEHTSAPMDFATKTALGRRFGVTPAIFW